MTLKWKAEKENGDGTGKTYYQTTISNPNGGSVIVLCYHPSKKRLWHFSGGDSGMTASYDGATWRDAGRLKTLLQNKRVD